jgi:hypothetical protein
MNHKVTIVDKGGNYRYQPVCSCGWQSRGYCTTDAAHMLADAHAYDAFAERTR